MKDLNTDFYELYCRIHVQSFLFLSVTTFQHFHSCSFAWITSATGEAKWTDRVAPRDGCHCDERLITRYPVCTWWIAPTCVILELPTPVHVFSQLYATHLLLVEYMVSVFRCSKKEQKIAICSSTFFPISSRLYVSFAFWEGMIEGEVTTLTISVPSSRKLLYR